MKKWTVMLIPHDRGGTRTVTVWNVHFWAVAAVMVALSFSSTFFYQRNNELLQRAELLKQANRALELENARIPEEPKPAGASRDELRQLETRLRAEYEASISAITSELNDLYEMETKARNITGLAPRTPQPAEPPSAVRGGKGGGPAGFAEVVLAKSVDVKRPPHVIYGMSRPSADLIVQEIRLRTQSLGDLVRDMEAQKEKVERMPAGWPVARGAGKLSSPFGYRLDPFTRRLRHHDGLDISARHGTPIVSTAGGVVREAGYASYYGNMVVVDHGGGIQTLYAHLSAISVSPGEKVTRGQVVGKMGSTGRSTGNHLHYEVHVQGRPVNPSKYLTK